MLKIQNISKNYEGFALKEISFEVEQGDYFMILGESGAGKSMVLETIAGLVSPDSGKILLDNKDITYQKIHDRRIGLVFQDYAVFPHLSVKANLEYPLHGSTMSHLQKKEQINKIAERTGIGYILNRKPSTLSGGELQRVALARTLMQIPRVLLLDEPLASLDSRMRSGLRSLLRRLNREGQTIIHVTHDYEEALSLGNRIAVMHKGRILQSGIPEVVFRNPRSEFVAHFTGARNFIRVELERENGKVFAIEKSGIRIALASEELTSSGFLLIRGEEILVSNDRLDSSAINNFQGVVHEIIPHKAGFELQIDIGFDLYAIITGVSLKHLDIRTGKKVWVTFKASAVRFISA